MGPVWSGKSVLCWAMSGSSLLGTVGVLLFQKVDRGATAAVVKGVGPCQVLLPFRSLAKGSDSVLIKMYIIV